MSTAIQARIRHGAPDADAARLPWMGSNAGRAIASEDDAPDLWQVIKTIQARHRAYLAAIDAPAPFPEISPIKPETDNSTGDAPPRPDPRPCAERSAQAIRAWDAIIDALRSANPVLIRYVDRVIIRDEPGCPALAMILRMPGLRAACGQ